MEVPDKRPDRCPVCACPYESVSQHESGVMVNLLDNARYQRVCFDPIAEETGAKLQFFHHSHEQLGTEPGSERPDSRQLKR